MYSRQDVKINTGISDVEKIIEMVQPVYDFANKHGVEFNIGFDGEYNFLASYEAEGKTSAYCKGVVAEIKQMLKEIFNCKVETLLYVY